MTSRGSQKKTLWISDIHFGQGASPLLSLCMSLYWTEKLCQGIDTPNIHTINCHIEFSIIGGWDLPTKIYLEEIVNVSLRYLSLLVYQLCNSESLFALEHSPISWVYVYRWRQAVTLQASDGSDNVNLDSSNWSYFASRPLSLLRTAERNPSWW